MNNIEFISQQISNLESKTHHQKPQQPFEKPSEKKSSLQSYNFKLNAPLLSKPPQSAADIALELMLLNDIQLKTSLKPPILQYYGKKTLATFANIFGSIGIASGLLQTEFFIDTPTLNDHLIFSGSIFAVIQSLGLTLENSLKKNKIIEHKTKPTITSPLLNQVISIFKNKLSINSEVVIEYTLEPKILCTPHFKDKNKLTLSIGAPLLHQLSNQAFYSLLFFRMSAFKVAQDKNCLLYTSPSPRD